MEKGRHSQVGEGEEEGMRQLLLNIKSLAGGWLYFFGVIERTTCFRWEMDASLGGRKP